MPKSNHPTYGITKVLVCDNGAEFHSSALKGLCYELAIDLQYCPKQQPQYKGTIERVIGTLNREVCQALKGTSFSDIEARGDYESIENAEATLEELIGLINRWILNDYSMRIHRGTMRVPSALWKEGLEIIEPNLPESAMKLEFAMTEKTTRTLTHKGIEIFNNFYNSPSLRVIRTRMTENQTVTVRYDVEDLGAIWVLDSVSNEYLKVPCDEREYTEGLTLVTHRHLRKTLNDKGRGEQNEKALLEHRARFNSEVNALGRSKKIRARQRFARLKENMTTSKVSINAITAKAEAPVVTEPFVIDDSLSFDTNNVGGAK
jgi:putative transposase